MEVVEKSSIFDTLFRQFIYFHKTWSEPSCCAHQCEIRMHCLSAAKRNRFLNTFIITSLKKYTHHCDI